MRVRKKSGYGKLYANILVSFTATIFITITALSTILYKNFENIALEQNYSLIAESLLQVKQGADFMASTAKNLSVQVYYDWYVSKLLYYDFPNDIDINSALTQLNYYRTTTPLIESIYVYNARTGTFYLGSSKVDNSIQSKETFYDKDVIDTLIKYHQYTPVERTIYTGEGNNNGNIQNVYSVIYWGSNGDPQKNNNAVVINVSNEWISKITDGYNKNLDSNTFIIDEKGSVISSTYKYPIKTDISNQEFVRKIFSSDSSNGYYVEKINKEKSLVSYIKSKELGWTFVRITPYSVIVEKITNLRDKTIMIGLLILFVGLLASFLESRKLYVPINDILSKLKKLESESKDAFYTVKKEFLRNILIEPKEHNLNYIQEQFDKFDIKLKSAEPVFVVLLKIDRYREFCDKYNSDDRALFKFAIINIATEIISQNCFCEAVDMGDDNIAVLINTKGLEQDKDCSTADKAIMNVQENVLKYLEISITTVVGTAADNINSMNISYNNVLEASYNRIFSGHGSIIYAKDVNESRKLDYEYPTQKEKMLIDNLMLDKMGEVKKLYLEIVDSIREYPYIPFNFVMSRLAFTINMAVNTIQKNNSSLLISPVNVDIIRIFINGEETIEEINKKVFEVFDEISAKLQDKKVQGHDHMVRSISDIVKRDYMNSNLSVEYIAELMDMSPTYVSRTFKKNTLKSITDYIAEVRMDKARDLLKNTGSTIEEIAEKTGFASSIYFHKSFKKYNGITPGEYRTNNKMNSYS